MTVPNIPLAKTVVPSDTSSSIVIGGSGFQTRCGKVQLTIFRDVAYGTSTFSGTQIPLKLPLKLSGGVIAPR
jgi:hypothetical protein